MDAYCLTCLAYVDVIPAGEEIPVACSLEPTAVVEDDTCPECGNSDVTYDDRRAVEATREALGRLADELRFARAFAKEIHRVRQVGGKLIKAESDLFEALATDKPLRRALSNTCFECGAIDATSERDGVSVCRGCATEGRAA